MKTLNSFNIAHEGENEEFVIWPSAEDFKNGLFVDSHEEEGIEMREDVEVEQLEEAFDHTYAFGVKKLIKAGSAVLWVDSGLVG